MKNTDKHKHITQIRVFFTRSQKMETEIFAVCAITFDRSWLDNICVIKKANRIKFIFSNKLPMH